MHIIFSLSGCFWQFWGAVPVLGPCISLYWQSLTRWLKQIFPFAAVEKGKGWLILHLSNQVDLSKESHHIRAGRGFRGHMLQPGGTGKTRRLRRGQGIHSVTGRVQNGNPGVLMIRLEALAIIWRRISLWWWLDCSIKEEWPPSVPCRRQRCSLGLSVIGTSQAAQTPTFAMPSLLRFPPWGPPPIFTLHLWPSSLKPFLDS